MTDLRIFTEPQQGASYQQLLDLALVAEGEGFDAFFRSDHYLSMGDGDGMPGSTDAWVTLAGLARETSTIRLGTLVTAQTFRLPGPLAISVAQVDQMSDGRVEFGLGTGWFDAEHTAYGIPFPSLRTRFEQLTEQLEVITGLWRTPLGDTFDYRGDHYELSDSPALPKPAQADGPPIIVGGGGQTKTPALAARFADEFNLPFSPVDDFVKSRERVRSACEKIDRDPDELVYSAAVVLCAGADEDEVTRRAANIGRDVDELRINGAAGTAEEVIDTIGRYVEAGAERLYLQTLDLDDHDHLRFVASEIKPHID